MAITYARATPPETLDPVNLAIRLSEAVGAAMPWLEGLSGAQASQPPAPGKWCPKEVVGHLIDSAVNNLQRIVRLETVSENQSEIRSPLYEQDAWVSAQNYAKREWAEILTLWCALNHHIAWTMRHVAQHHLTRLCVFPDHQMTFGFLLEDYIAHMEYHLAALKASLQR